MTAHISKDRMTFVLPEMQSYHSTWDDADYAPQTPAPHRSVLRRLAHGVAEYVRVMHERHVARAELETMTDRELADMGINRFDVNRLFDEDFIEEHASRGA